MAIGIVDVGISDAMPVRAGQAYYGCAGEWLDCGCDISPGLPDFVDDLLLAPKISE
jgi:hypothetical protein